jgi:ribosome modulation factor
MKLVRFIAKAIHGDMVMNPGDEKMVEDSYGGAHVVDVATGQMAVPLAPPAQAVFRADLAHRPPGSGLLAGPTTEDEARAFGRQFGGVIEAVLAHLWAEIDRLRADLAKATGQQPAGAAVAPVSGAEGIPPTHLAEIEADGRHRRAESGSGTPPPDLTPDELAAWQKGWNEADFEANTAARPGAPGGYAGQMNGDIIAAGHAAFDAGKPREAPAELTGTQVSAWLNGWDAAQTGAATLAKAPTGDDQTRIADGFASAPYVAPPIDQHIHGFNARVDNAPRVAPDGLSEADATAWLAGWDEANNAPPSAGALHDGA